MSNSTPQLALIAGLLALSLTGDMPSVARAQSLGDGSAHRALVNRYCVTCHNEKVKTAGLLLDKANLENVAADGELWEKVIRKLRGNSMPPPGVPRPDAATLKAFSKHLESELDRAAEAHPNPGRTA